MTADVAPICIPPGWRIVAVTVTYHPDVALLRRQLAALAPQVYKTVLVDNGSPPEILADIARDAPNNLCLLSLGDNLGVATAQNRGFAAARTEGCTHVVLLDQDSVPAPDMVTRLAHTLADLEMFGQRPAVVGPNIIDSNHNAALGYLVEKNGRIVKCRCADKTPMRVDTLISSGMLIPLAVFDAVGGMEDGLFIDAVDTEWCLRARAMGYGVFADCATALSHQLGDRTARIWLCGWRQRHVHSPLRSYYITRNNLALCLRSRITLAWRIRLIYILLMRLGLFLTFGPCRMQHLKMMWRGALDAMNKRTGIIDSAR